MAQATFNPAAFVSGSYSSISGQNNPVGKSQTSTSYATITCNTGSRAKTYAFWSFNCSSIPNNATIDSVACVAKCYVSSTSRISTRSVQLYNGTSTAKGSSVTFSNSTSSTQTLNCGTWTRAELNTCYIRVAGTRGTSQTSTSTTLRFYGATLTVTYTEASVQHTITTSCTGEGTIVPSGSSVVEEGNDFILTITPINIRGTIVALDNGSNVSNQLVRAIDHGITVEKPSGVSYGFEEETYNGMSYYAAKNKGISSSLGVAQLNFTVQEGQTGSVEIHYINYSQATYDYMGFGKVDTSIGTSYNSMTTTNCQKLCSSNSDNVNSEQTIIYTDIPSGEHYIQIGYRKNSSTNSNLDLGYFRLGNTTGITTGYLNYYTYTINSVQENHSISIEFIAPVKAQEIWHKSGNTWKEVDTIYYKQNNTWKEVDMFYLKVNNIWYPTSPTPVVQTLLFHAPLTSNMQYKSYLDNTTGNITATDANRALIDNNMLKLYSAGQSNFAAYFGVPQNLKNALMNSTNTVWITGYVVLDTWGTTSWSGAMDNGFGNSAGGRDDTIHNILGVVGPYYQSIVGEPYIAAGQSRWFKTCLSVNGYMTEYFQQTQYGTWTQVKQDTTTSKALWNHSISTLYLGLGYGNMTAHIKNLKIWNDEPTDAQIYNETYN